MIDWATSEVAAVFVLPARCRVTSSVKSLHQAEMMQRRFALVLVAPDFVQGQVVKMERVAQFVRLAASSRREATVDQLNRERKSLHCPGKKKMREGRVMWDEPEVLLGIAVEGGRGF